MYEQRDDGGRVARSSAKEPDSSGTLVAWVRAHPVISLLVWFYPVGWLIAFIPLVAKNALNVDLSLEAFLIPATLLGLLLPSIVITRMVGGAAGVDELRRRIVKARVSIGWYVLALFAVPILAVALATIVFGPPTVIFTDLLAAI